MTPLALTNTDWNVTFWVAVLGVAALLVGLAVTEARKYQEPESD